MRNRTMVYGAASVYKGINLRGREAYTTVPNTSVEIDQGTFVLNCTGNLYTHAEHSPGLCCNCLQSNHWTSDN